MKRKSFLILVVALFALITAFAFVACDDEPQTSAPKGDGIFTEDATYEEIIAALENAESFKLYNKETKIVKDDTFSLETETEIICNFGVDALHIYSNRDKIDSSGNMTKTYSNEYIYRANGIDYYIFNESENDFVENEAYKDLEQIGGKDYYSEMRRSYIYDDIIDLLTAGNDGGAVVNPQAFEAKENYIQGSAYVKLMGDSIEIGWDENSQLTIMDILTLDAISHKVYIYNAVNTTTVEIPDEFKALEASAEWVAYVRYNGVAYRKATDSDGNEFYYVDSIFEPGSVPETTINTLPVRSE